MGQMEASNSIPANNRIGLGIHINKDDLGKNVFFIAYLSDSSFSRYFFTSDSVAKSVLPE